MEYLENKGQTAVAVSINGCTEVVLGIMDHAKDEAALTVNVLQHVFGIKVHMLTGDNFLEALPMILAFPRLMSWLMYYWWEKLII